MTKPPGLPWRRVVALRDDVRTGELSLADFAADLHDVMMQRGARPVYEDPARFFALTFPPSRCASWRVTSCCGSPAGTRRRSGRSS